MNLPSRNTQKPFSIDLHPSESEAKHDELPLLTATAIARVREGVAAACDRTVHQAIQSALNQVALLAKADTDTRVSGQVRRLTIKAIIYTLFRVNIEYPERLPQGAALIAPNHLNHIDIFLLLAELPASPYCYVLGDARTLYNKGWKRQILQRAGGVIPLERRWKEENAAIAAAQAGQKDLVELAVAIKQNVSSGNNIQNLRQIDRAVQAIFARGDSVILFPEGRLGSHEGKLHLPLKRGTAIYALRANVPIVPVALIGTHDLYLGKTLTIRFGKPLYFPQTKRPKRQEIDGALKLLQTALSDLLPDHYQEPDGPKLFRHFLNHMFW